MQTTYPVSWRRHLADGVVGPNAACDPGTHDHTRRPHSSDFIRDRIGAGAKADTKAGTKRHDDVVFDAFRDAGILPEMMVNFPAHEVFAVRRVQSSPANFDTAALREGRSKVQG